MLLKPGTRGRELPGKKPGLWVHYTAKGLAIVGIHGPWGLGWGTTWSGVFFLMSLWGSMGVQMGSGTPGGEAFSHVFVSPWVPRAISELV